MHARHKPDLTTDQLIWTQYVADVRPLKGRTTKRLVGGRTLRTVAACLVMTIVLLLLRGLEGGTSLHDLNLIILISAGFASFSGAALALGALRIDELTELLSRRPNRGEAKLDPARGTG